MSDEIVYCVVNKQEVLSLLYTVDDLIEELNNKPGNGYWLELKTIRQIIDKLQKDLEEATI